MHIINTQERDLRNRNFEKLNKAIGKNNLNKVKKLLEVVNPNELIYPEYNYHQSLAVYVEISVKPIDIIFTALAYGTDEIWNLVKEKIIPEGILNNKVRLQEDYGYNFCIIYSSYNFFRKFYFLFNKTTEIKQKKLAFRFNQILDVNGIDVNKQFSDGSTILSIIAKNMKVNGPFIDIVERLCEKGADINSLSNIINYIVEHYEKLNDIIRFGKLLKKHGFRLNSKTSIPSEIKLLKDEIEFSVDQEAEVTQTQACLMILISLGFSPEAENIYEFMWGDLASDDILYYSTGTLSSEGEKASLEQVLSLEGDNEAKKKFILYFCHTNPKDFVIDELKKVENYTCSDELKIFSLNCMEYTKNLGSGDACSIIFQVLFSELNDQQSTSSCSKSGSISKEIFFNFTGNLPALSRIEKYLGDDFIIKNHASLIKYIDSLKVSVSSEISNVELDKRQICATQNR